MTNLADIMGRAAIHSGKIITWDEAMASNFQLVPEDRPDGRRHAPAGQPDAEGRHPVPVPGAWTEI